jgi:hypothetical protein
VRVSGGPFEPEDAYWYSADDRRRQLRCLDAWLEPKFHEFQMPRSDWRDEVARLCDEADLERLDELGRQHHCEIVGR